MPTLIYLGSFPKIYLLHKLRGISIPFYSFQLPLKLNKENILIENKFLKEFLTEKIHLVFILFNCSYKRTQHTYFKKTSIQILKNKQVTKNSFYWSSNSNISLLHYKFKKTEFYNLVSLSKTRNFKTLEIIHEHTTYLKEFSKCHIPCFTIQTHFTRRISFTNLHPQFYRHFFSL